MMTTDTALAERVRDLIRAMAPEQNVEVHDDRSLTTDLGFDSLRLMELTVVLERVFDLPRYRPEQLAGVLRVGQVVDLISGSVAGERP